MPSTSRSTPPAWLVLCLLTALGAAVASPAAAAADAAASPPERGARMHAVEASLGAPSERHEAVGTPPISRWDYPGFVVFFENDRVIHAVRLNPAG
jgi:hypothetical protein